MDWQFIIWAQIIANTDDDDSFVSITYMQCDQIWQIFVPLAKNHIFGDFVWAIIQYLK